MRPKGLKTVSIPSNGSIQFLPELRKTQLKSQLSRLNPLKRVNSILTVEDIGR